jgi:hypothetical protein
VKLDLAIAGAQEAEEDLAAELRRVGEEHASEADLYHLGHTLAQMCAENLERLNPFAERYGASAAAEHVEHTPGLLEAARRKAGGMLGRKPIAGLHLMRDLQRGYLAAGQAEIAWTVLLQAARAARDAELIDAASTIAEQAEVRVRWLRTRIKEAAPQVYASD